MMRRFVGSLVSAIILALVGVYIVYITTIGADINLLSLSEQDQIQVKTVNYDGFSQKLSEEASEETIVFSEDYISTMSNYTYAVVKTQSFDSIQHILVINLNDKTVVEDNVKHDYLRNKTFIFAEEEWQETQDTVEILDWSILDMISIKDVLPTLLGEFWIPDDLVGVEQEGIQYFSGSKEVVVGDESLLCDITYITKGGELLSVVVKSGDVTNSLQFVDLG